MTRHLDQVEEQARVGQLREEFQKRVEHWREFVKEKGRSTELEALAREFAAAMDRRDTAIAEAKRDALDRLTQHLWINTIDYWMGLLQYLYERYQELKLMALAGSRFDQGVRAANANDIQGLHDICMELIQLLPREEQGKLEVPGDRIVSHVQ
jgi:hypothetical protein